MALPWNSTSHSNQNHPPSATGVDKYFIWLDEDDDGLVTKAELKSVLKTILDDYEKGREGSYESDCLDLSCLVLSCCARALGASFGGDRILTRPGNSGSV